MASRRRKPRKYQAAAIITIRNAGEMSARGRRRLADWLRRHAAFLLKHGKDYSGRFVGRYLYEAPK